MVLIVVTKRLPNDNALVVKTKKLPTEESLQAKSERDISDVSP